MEIVRLLLAAATVSPTNLRYDATCNCIQQTTDGGTTWVDQPGADVRHADAWRLPPSSSPDARCDAAARIAAAWQADLEVLYQTVNVSTFATTILQGLLLLAGGAGVLIDLIILVLEGLITIGVSNIQASFTSEVWDGIECIIYCHIGDDGQVSADQAAAIMNDVAAQYPGTVYNTLVQLQNLYGEVLMSNAGVERTETGDCDSCVCLTCDNCTVPTDAFWSQPACVGGVGADTLVFTEEGMFSSLDLPSIQGAIADLNDFSAPGVSGWSVCYQTTEGISMVEATAAEAIDPTIFHCYLGSTTDLTLTANNPVLVPASQPIVFLAWLPDDNGITGLCVTPV